MPLFRCLLRGENFSGSLLGQAEPVGFTTTRFVEAESEQEAEVLAVERLFGEGDLALSGKYKTKDSRVYLEEIEAVATGSEVRPDEGFAFFTMGA